MPIDTRVLAVVALFAATPALVQAKPALLTYDVQQKAVAEWDAATGVQDAGLSVADEKLAYYSFQFPFNYFGYSYTGVWVETNGVLNLEGGAMSFDPWNSAAKLGGQVKIAPAWDDWVFNVSGTEPNLGVWVSSSPDKFVVTWIGRHYHGNVGDVVSFQAVLFPNGVIQFNHGGYVSSPYYAPTATVGISVADPAHALAWDTTDLTPVASHVFTPHADATPPVTTATPPGGWFPSDVTVTLSATDDATGVASTQYSVDAYAYVYSAPFVLSSEGISTLQFFSTDFAGNIEPTQMATIGIDRTPPAVAIVTPANGAVYDLCSPVVADWSASDGGSGIASATGTLPVAGVLDTTVAGTFTFTVGATDLVGNVSNTTSTYSVVATKRNQKCR